ncbi:hypothetical protein PR001_g9034 [Phytophthora rubi]|uniref:Reverse transcriptase domain-containing protein n=1 Tax=Phytophthora rubi TaxID=129364 RepID=A0A6A3MXV0_9STRA|nr:hypothetical protein PR002_g14651 [Phytophthora rubi]KAE9036015.1 hypothetical protein PR001_g9034 [Phytophthora rubi]
MEASDGLPKAMMSVDSDRPPVKLESGARYSVAGTARGKRLRGPAPVDFVEGIGGLLLDVVGVWSFDMRNAFVQRVELAVCIIDGCTDEFLVDVDFMQQHKATMDFARNEVRYVEKNLNVVILFRTENCEGNAKVAAVRLVRRDRLARNAVTPMQKAVAAPDGDEGIFVPTRRCGTVMLAVTVTKAKAGKTYVPVINKRGDRTKLPAKKELGMWTPMDDDMQALKINGQKDKKRLPEWLETLGDSTTPLENEDKVRIDTEGRDGRVLILKLLLAYSKVSSNKGDCPSATTLGVHHHIDMGDAAPIMMIRRRHAQKEDTIIEDNMKMMLNAGVIEEGNGAWDFPVVLVRKKDSEVRFCSGYRALNTVTKKDVYPLPRIDETLETLGDALLFTTLDLRAGYWQIRVAPENRDKTAFTTKQGLYRFVRMPFRLMNAPSTFQRMMNGVLRGMTWTTCLVYLDDIMAYTRGDIERHVLELATVLEMLSVAGLALKIEEVCLCVTSNGIP